MFSLLQDSATFLILLCRVAITAAEVLSLSLSLSLSLRDPEDHVLAGVLLVSDPAESLGAGEFTTKFCMVGERALMIRTECRIFFSSL
jgi:hypothetical protein